MRVELRELQRRLDITSLYVTHDQEEALAISDRVIVMSGGRIEQIGTPEDIYNRPVSRFVADFVGSANMIEGHVLSTDPLMFETRASVKIRAAVGSPDSTTLALRSSYIHLRPDETNQIAGSDPSPHVPRRLHSIRYRLARRPVDRAPPSNRIA